MSATISAIAVLGGFGCVAACNLAARTGDPRSWPRQEFRSHEWKATSPEGRYVFCRDLLDRNLLSSRLRSEVIELLGKPSFAAPGGSYVTYVVKSALPGEYSTNAVYLLHIDFNDQNRVSKAFIRSD